MLLAPLLLVIATGLLLLQGRPLIYRQKRLGLGGQPFLIMKFRTMDQDADQVSSFDTSASTRMTPMGRLIKPMRLDELPQLINLLIGHMTLVGPRPLSESHSKYLDQSTQKVLQSTKPGLTDPVALAFVAEDEVLADTRSPEAMYLALVLPEKARRQVEYLGHRNAWRDLLVVLRTPTMLWSPRCRAASARRVRQILDLS